MMRRLTVSRSAKGAPFLSEGVGSQRGASPYETRVFSYARGYLCLARFARQTKKKERLLVV